MNQINENENKGFSLVELIVVIAIMAVLTSVLAPSLLGYVEKSRMQKDDSAMGEVANAIKLALADQNVYDECLAYNVTNNYSCYKDANAADTAKVLEANASRCSVDTEMALRGGCRVKLHAGPGLVKRGGQQDSEVKFVFDQDLFMPGQLEIKLSTGALQTLHSQADSIFRGAITSLVHNAMEPRDF